MRLKHERQYLVMKDRMSITRLKNRAISKLSTRFPLVAKIFMDAFTPLETKDIPWSPIRKPLAECKVAMVTTAGVHHRDQLPFDMNDRDGDPTFRILDISRPAEGLTITHDYYDHSDADKDINIVFPVHRLKEFKEEGYIGDLATSHYGFMGHIVGRHVETLVNKTAPDVAKRLLKDNVDIVLLTPG